MEVKRRTQADRSAASRAALIAAARALFTERGFAGVGTTDIARAAGVTRGALYHQFTDKAGLFAAVAETVEAEVTQRLVDELAGSALAPLEALHAAVDAWIAACDDPEVRQVLLLDGPVVLGWEGLRDLAQRYGLGLTEQLLQATMDNGDLPRLPVTPLAHVLVGALQEAAFVISAEPEHADDTALVVHTIIDRLAGGG